MDHSFPLRPLRTHTSILISRHQRPRPLTRLSRAFKSIDPTAFSNDILASDLHTSTPSSLNQYLSLFNSTITSILDIHAPLKSFSCPSRPSKPFITPEILHQKRIRSKLETISRRTRSPLALADFKFQAKHVSKLITSSKRSYFRDLISKHKNNSRRLWSTLNSLLSRK